MNSGGRGFGVVEEFRESEVEHLYLARRRDHHVARLDIAMNDAAAMRGGECFSDLQTDQQRGLEFEWTARDELAHVLAFDELHRDEVNAVNFIEIEDRADVWVVQRRGESRFAFETFE